MLFTDLVGSTALSQRLGQPEALEVSGKHFAALRDSLAVHRGREVKSTGDGLMASFESTVDAISAAVTMQRAIARHNRRHPDVELGVRIGISIGEVAPVGDDWFGTAVVEAARLCAACDGGEIYVSDVLRLVAGTQSMHKLDEVGELDLKGLPDGLRTWKVDWDSNEEFALRVALADDSAVLRQGVAMALKASGMEVVMEAGDADTIVASVAAARPHVVVLDMRMPPTHTIEGLVAAEQIRAEHPEVGVLVLSAAVDATAARRLLSSMTQGVGYLLKDRITDMDELCAAIRTVASGGAAIDPEVVAVLREG